MRKSYYMTDSLGGILKKSSNDRKALKMMNDALDFYIKQYKDGSKEVDAPSLIRSFHIALDEAIEAKKELMPTLAKDVKCESGCSFCCYCKVDISRDEAKLMKAAIEEGKLKIDMARLVRQVVCTSKKTWGRLALEEKRCVFLDDSDLCEIYEYRPAACRKLLVITDPDLCNLKAVQKVGRFVDWHIEVIASAILNGSKCGTLPEMLLGEL